MDQSEIDQVLDKLVREVEGSVHAFYRGDVRQHTQRVKTDTFVREARQALLQMLGGGASATESASAPSSAGAPSPLSAAEIAAATRCVMGWMPMGPPNAASPDSRCVAAAREMSPTWGERERARAALKRLTG